jgi:hypothetical protein
MTKIWLSYTKTDTKTKFFSISTDKSEPLLKNQIYFRRNFQKNLENVGFFEPKPKQMPKISDPQSKKSNGDFSGKKIF